MFSRRFARTAAGRVPAATKDVSIFARPKRWQSRSTPCTTSSTALAYALLPFSWSAFPVAAETSRS
eukprot:scaffold764_cov248-Pinguiococcus_pyrenoidosus.AAC.19